MPNCFSLTRKGETETASLSDVDVEICNMLGVEVDKKYWVGGWYGTIGLLLAMGRSFEDINTIFNKESDEHPDETDIYSTLKRILAFLSENYVSDCWYESRR